MPSPCACRRNAQPGNGSAGRQAAIRQDHECQGAAKDGHVARKGTNGSKPSQSEAAASNLASPPPTQPSEKSTMPGEHHGRPAARWHQHLLPRKPGNGRDNDEKPRTARATACWGSSSSADRSRRRTPSRTERSEEAVCCNTPANSNAHPRAGRAVCKYAHRRLSELENPQPRQKATRRADAGWLERLEVPPLDRPGARRRRRSVLVSSVLTLLKTLFRPFLKSQGRR